MPFNRALNIATKEGNHKSVFTIQEKTALSGIGCTADLCLFVRYADRNTMQVFEFQSWQFIKPGHETFYIHGEIDLSTYSFIHLDGAKIDLSDENIHSMLYSKERPRGPKVKLFRIDGHVESNVALSIIKGFFPIEELSDEAFCVS
ncbi:hypothetical protein KC685_04935 [Candidatus Dojkabacteria bacterium]|uniref:Uncharacterized protein n=1 Tax=Candidatus Dojkabacteria bacterium TaxID=2099670 RepID=A0A955I3F0_9BACT|nr:hypothetical protein [Candidatus Dojkabacteria bacterium]